MINLYRQNQDSKLHCKTWLYCHQFRAVWLFFGCFNPNEWPNSCVIAAIWFDRFRCLLPKTVARPDESIPPQDSKYFHHRIFIPAYLRLAIWELMSIRSCLNLSKVYAHMNTNEQLTFWSTSWFYCSVQIFNLIGESISIFSLQDAIKALRRMK